MLNFEADGGGYYSCASESNQARGILRVGPDGLLAFGRGKGGVMNGVGVLCAGDSVLVSRFLDDRPVGTALWSENSLPLLRDFSSKSSSGTSAISSDGINDFLDELAESSDSSPSVEICQSLVSHQLCGTQPSWESVIPTAYRVASVDQLENVSLSGLSCKLGVVGRTRVLLVPMTASAPSGNVSLAPGLAVKQVDVWLRRFERMINTADYPENVLRPVGCYFSEGWYLVSLFPTDVLQEDLLEGPPVSSGLDSSDAIIDIIQYCAKSVAFCHASGLTFNGFLNREAFILTNTGRVFLSTAYLLSRWYDRKQVFGGLTASELRFLPPSRFPTLSLPIEAALKTLKLECRVNRSQVEDDQFSLGLLILSFVSRTGLPLHHLQIAQYALCSISSSCAACPVPWLSAAWTGSVETGFARSIDDIPPLERMAIKLMNGETGIADLIQSIDKYLEWRDQVSDASVKTEVKAMLTMVTGALKTSQDFMKFR